MSDSNALYLQAAAINAALEVTMGLHTLQPSSTDADGISSHRHIGGLLEVIRLAAEKLTADLCALAEDEPEEDLTPPAPARPPAPEPRLTPEQQAHARQLLQPAFEYLDEVTQPEPA